MRILAATFALIAAVLAGALLNGPAQASASTAYAERLATAAGYMHAPSVDNPEVNRYCVIRFDKRVNGKTVPRLHANSAHYCTGVKSVRVEADGDLFISMDSVGPIGTVQVTEDETFTEKGISCGPSQGEPTVTIRCFSRAGNKVSADGPTIHHPLANLWVFTVSWDRSAA